MLIAVGTASESLLEKAQYLAHQLNLPINSHADYCLWVTETGLALRIPNGSFLSADFSVQRFKREQARKHPLIRACKPRTNLKIIDATAGWGKDAGLLAYFGAQVLMVERHPIMYTLLKDALSRRTPEDEQKMNVSLAPLEPGGATPDAINFLLALPPQQYPELIYIDPMHPARRKSALVKKDMQALQQVIGPDKDALTLIDTARTRVLHQVVVKWPQKLKPLVATSTCILGKTVRYDLYSRKFSQLLT